jgi:3-deoxy-D-manno-octulosonate 8-phosphate phosphatase (KDO 8-P phosphatase)
MDTPSPASFSGFVIDLIVYDFDGVMTNNRVHVFEDGREAVQVNRADGLGVNMIKSIGIPQIILSTETNPVVSARARKLGLECLQGVDAKEVALERYCVRHGYPLEGVLYVGNDLNDLEVMRVVGIPIAPADAHPQILRTAKLTLASKGGDGVVRELAGYLEEIKPKRNGRDDAED